MGTNYDVVIVGGGPAGMMAAASAAAHGASVQLLEKNDQLGRKMLITGGGRCNLTNRADVAEMVANIPGNGKFVYSSLHRFSGQDLRNFFKRLGLATKVEDHGRVFPISDKAQDVVNALTKHLHQLGVRISLGTGVTSLMVENNHCRGVMVGETVIRAKAVVLATGGVSYPRTGSTGEGHKMAERVGHHVTKLFPAAVAITCTDPWIVQREVQGLSLANVNITVFNSRDKRLATETGDIIFTHWGLSGPGALRVGRAVALERQREPDAPIRGALDLFPTRSSEELARELGKLAQAAPKKSVKNLLIMLVPERLVKVLLELAGMPPETPGGPLNKTQLAKLADLLKALPVHIKGTRPIEEATVTGGGVNIKEIDPRTMGSKLIRGLFFAGEILDVDAHTGGFNMQVAFSTGYVAGEAAALFVKETLD
ncbi:HI0933 family protein [Desulfotomaculum nigrificans CO-1-SRB]|uniref:HI0933 family protein n=1 Tax=Desulfotomaculum nigrificans (strain DSM 14880 / VKM B-2319 / CO-1-SRB) TaxID=868595 RepID=F6B730_DESCC|nr:NAD(P)/FAD-dependent oxidoreductase [Desulfotomaculum nigrificans]AEF94455.1 HI0933 family protein [Desulfotomaculum nigrificans CO-1-SRB]